MKPEIVLNANERERFLSSIQKTRYAGIDKVRTIYRTKSLNAHRREFLDNKRGFRDGHRAALFMEVIQLKNAEAAVLSFFIALSQAGFKGTVCPEDVLANQVVDSTGAKCAPRTFRRALSSLCAAGWLVKRSLATGSKVSKPGGGWTTLQVNKITIPRCTFMLGSNKSPKKSVVVPRPNGPAIGEAKQVTPLSKGGLPCLDLVNSKNQSKERNDESKLATAQQSATTPPPTSPPLKHQAIDGEGRKEHQTGSNASPVSPDAPNKPPKRAVHPFGRKARSKIPDTWANARKLLLHDLEVAGVGSFELKTAALQTDLRYPPLLPVALDWDKLVPGWIQRDWKDRRRAIMQEILPELAAYCLPLVPPDPKFTRPGATPAQRAKAERQMKQFERVSRIMKSLPEMLVTEDTPNFVRKIISEKAWTLSQIPSLLAMGRISLNEITQQEFEDFSKIAELLNLSD